MSVVQDLVTGFPPEDAAGSDPAARALWPGRTPAGITVAAVLSLLAWAVLAEIVAAMAGLAVRPSALWPPVRRVLSVTFGDPVVPAVAMAVIVCGAGLTALAVIPGRPRLVPLEGDDPLLVIGLTRSGLRRTLAAAAWEAVDGEGFSVEHVGVRVLRRQIEVTVETDADRAGELLREVGAAVGDRLSGLGAQGHHEVVVRLRGRRT
ncbi:DUF6286 domain-containing protein [Sphaerimonospora thailandensis]|uniref:DUF6286 domain-containing protein n=1 Tax=Sphaerimonospora thailandensis TaxID=795644 RepID=A0A8J3RA65_9ACTN|nr:DUF6286 domain-containing protein [Sphaerimonospora thailandensis]GIH70596.1 hypothetical protein Mth01_28490 [Sphaerimonospora thailandensis]